MSISNSLYVCSINLRKPSFWIASSSNTSWTILPAFKRLYFPRAGTNRASGGNHADLVLFRNTTIWISRFYLLFSLSAVNHPGFNIVTISHEWCRLFLYNFSCSMQCLLRCIGSQDSSLQRTRSFDEFQINPQILLLSKTACGAQAIHLSTGPIALQSFSIRPPFVKCSAVFILFQSICF